MAVYRGWKGFGSLAVAGAALASLYIVAPGPALALDDGEQDIFSTLLSTVGLGQEKAPDEQIDYRQRAPLVVPPTMDLPPPQSANNNPAWPKDPDVARRAKALALAHQPASNQVGRVPQGQLAPNQLAPNQDVTGAIPPTATDNTCINAVNQMTCSPGQFWAMLGTKSSRQETLAVPVGVDPGRAFLTDPPPGYRIATKAVKATGAGPAKPDTASDPAAYYREQALRDQSRDGLDQ